MISSATQPPPTAVLDQRAHTAASAGDRSERTFVLAVSLTYVLVTSVAAFYHEMWRDELQAWLLARDSGSVWEVIRNLNYDGHPGLWHLMLFAITRWSWNPELMKPLHLAISAASVYLICRYAPFTRLQKVLLVFGYYVAFEYSILARNYGLGLLLICVFCVLFPSRYRRIVPLASVVFLLCHSSAHGLIVALALIAGLVFEVGWRRIWREESLSRTALVLGLGIMLLGVVTAVWQLLPPEDSGYATRWRLWIDEERIVRVLWILPRSLFALPVADGQFWNPKGLLRTWPLLEPIDMVAFVGIAFVTLMALARRPAALIILIVGTSGLLAFSYLKVFGGARHHGFIFLVFLAVLWIRKDCEQTIASSRRPNRWLPPLQGLVTACFAIQFVGGLTALGMDFQHTFSAARETAEYLRSNGLDEAPMVGEADFAVAGVVAFLERDQVYYPRGDRFGSFIRWDAGRRDEPTDEQLFGKARQLAEKYRRDTVLVLTRPVPHESPWQAQLEHKAEFTGAVAPGEDFFIYVMPFQPERDEGAASDRPVRPSKG